MEKQQISIKDTKIMIQTNGDVIINTPSGLASFKRKLNGDNQCIIAVFIQFPNDTDNWATLADQIEKSNLATVRNYNKEKQAMYLIPCENYERQELAELIAEFL